MFTDKRSRSAMNVELAQARHFCRLADIYDKLAQLNRDLRAKLLTSVTSPHDFELTLVICEEETASYEKSAESARAREAACLQYSGAWRQNPMPVLDLEECNECSKSGGCMPSLLWGLATESDTKYEHRTSVQGADKGEGWV